MARGILLTLVGLVALTLPAVAPADDDTTYTVDARVGKAFVGIPDLADDGIPTTPVLTATVSDGAEPTILVDKLGRGMLVGDQKGVLRSTNGGLNWFRVNVPYIPGNHPLVGGIYDGWALAQDDAGTIYASTTDGAVINVASSVDGGATWQLGASTFVVDGGGIADRPWLAARGDGQVAVTWNVGGLGVQACEYSSDGAFTFTRRTVPVPLQSGGVTPTGDGLAIGGLPAWYGNGQLVYAGNGFGTAKTLYRYAAPPCGTTLFALQLPAAGDQMSTQVATDGTKIYVATPTPDNSGVQVIGYNTWTDAGRKTLVVSPATLKGATFTTIASRAGEIAVGFYGTPTAGDFQTPGFNGQWNVYVARVKDFWTATPQVRIDQVTATPNHVGDFCFQGTNCDVDAESGDRDLLDYWQLTYDAAGNVHLAYGHDGATANAEVRYAMLPVWT